MGVIMATYLDNAGVTQILTKIKSLLAKKAEITAIPTKTSQLTNDSSYQTQSDVSSSISTRLGELDVPTTGGATKYICSISQTNGVISAKEKDFEMSSVLPYALFCSSPPGNRHCRS